MTVVNLIFPHQLFEDSPLIINKMSVYLVEEYLFFRQYAFHKQKLAFHRATMKFYAHYLETQGLTVHYIDAQNVLSDIRKLIPALKKEHVKKIHFIDPVDNWLEKRLLSGCRESGIQPVKYDNPMFVNNDDDLKLFFKTTKKKFFQTDFYKAQRKKHQILLDEKQKPAGGKWTFDKENRKKYPKNKIPPAIEYPSFDEFYNEAVEYVRKNFPGNPGTISQNPLYPLNFKESRKWLQQFLERRFEEFGPYEDALVAEHGVLHHSVLSPLLNTGLITPKQVIDSTLQFTRKHEIPINSVEGFIRQIMGWREFIRGIYMTKGTVERTTNFWGFTRKIPESFYNATTGIDPIDLTIKKVLKTGYAHHIERLMVLANFMLLCEFDPDEVYQWFMEMFIDAYDWVMVPNVYGMSQFADGGLMATKPYISGSNYLMKMSNYPKGSWQKLWDALFWRFMHVHREFFFQNPRLGMLVKTFDKMSGKKKREHLNRADQYLRYLDS
jgi:deoxyribodipyrimidine photolyase-related protein